MENKTPESIQQEAAILPNQPTQFESAFMGAMPDEPNVFTLTNEINAIAADSMMDTDVFKTAREYREQKLQPYKDITRERTEREQEALAQRIAKAEENKPIIDDVIDAAFEVDNWFGAALLNVPVPIMEAVPGYDPLTDEDLDGYWPIVSEIAKYRNPEQVRIVKEKFDREKMNRAIIASASTGDAIAGSIIAGLADPLNLLLFAGAFATAGKTANAVRVAGISASMTGLQETLLHDNQYMRTLDESAVTVMSSLLLDSAVGGSAAMFRVAKELPAQTRAAKAEVEEYLRTGGITETRDAFDDSAGAMRVFEEEVKLKTFDKAKQPIRWALGNAAYFMSKIATPIGRGLSASSNKARVATASLAETNIELTGNFGNVAAETLVKVDMRRAAAAKLEVYDIEKAAKKEYNMDSDTFATELDYAQRRGDVHENPLVEKAAKRLRAVTQELWDRAAAQRIKGTFIEKADGTVEPIKTSTALSYQTRVYDLKKVDGDYGGFIGAIKEGTEDARVTNNNKVESDVNSYRAKTAEEMKKSEETMKQGQANKDAKRAVINNHETAIRGNDKTIGRLKSKDPNDPRIAELEARNKEIIKKKKALQKEIAEQDKLISAARLAMSKNAQHIKKMQERIIAPYTDTDLDAYAQSFYESVVGLKDGDMHYAVGAKPNILKQRTPIKDSYLEPFLEKNWEKRLEQTTKSLSPRTRLAEKFGEQDGDFEMTRVIDDIKEDYNGRIMDLREQGDIKAANKLQAEKNKQVDNIQVMRDRLLGRAKGEDRNSIMHSIGRSLLNFNSARMLNGMLLSSLPEMSKMMARYGMRNFNNAVIKAAKNIKIKDLPQDDAMRLSSAIYRAQGLRTAQMSDVYDLTPTTALESGTRRLSQMTAYWSGQQGFDSLFKSVAGALSQDGMARMIRAGDTKALRKLGFNDTEIDIMTREIGKAKEMGGLWELNSDMWNYSSRDIELGFRPMALKDKIDAAIVKDADTMIVQPGIGDLPKFYNSITGRILMQFKSFIMGATNRTLVPMIQGGNVELFKNMAYMNSLALLGHVAYETGVGRDVKWDNPEFLVNEMMNRGGYMGYATELMELYRRMAGKTAASRYRGRNDVGAFLGPSFGTAKDLMRAVSLQRDTDSGEFLTDVDARLHALRKLLPFQNHFLIRQVIDNLEGAAAKGLGGEGRFAGPSRGGPVQ